MSRQYSELQENNQKSAQELRPPNQNAAFARRLSSKRRGRAARALQHRATRSERAREGDADRRGERRAWRAAIELGLTPHFTTAAQECPRCMAGVAGSAWGLPAHLVNTVSHQARRNVGFVQELHDCRSAAPWFSRRGRISPTAASGSVNVVLW